MNFPKKVIVFLLSALLYVQMHTVHAQTTPLLFEGVFQEGEQTTTVQPPQLVYLESNPTKGNYYFLQPDEDVALGHLSWVQGGSAWDLDICSTDFSKIPYGLYSHDASRKFSGTLSSDQTGGSPATYSGVVVDNIIVNYQNINVITARFGMSRFTHDIARWYDIRVFADIADMKKFHCRTTPENPLNPITIKWD